MAAKEIVAYYRVSTQMQGVGGLGMEAQCRAVDAYAAFRGLPIVAGYRLGASIFAIGRSSFGPSPTLVDRAPF